jgi:hypothetical protein
LEIAKIKRLKINSCIFLKSASSGIYLRVSRHKTNDTMKQIGKIFEEFITTLLEKQNYKPKLLSHTTDRGVDIEVEHQGSVYGIEVKIYRTRRIAISQIRNSLIQLQHHIQANFEGGFLIITVNIEPSLRDELENEFNLEIIDRGLLFSLTRNDDHLRGKLESILLEVAQTGEDDIYEGVFETKENFKLRFLPFSKTSKPIVTTGKDLCDEFNSIVAGRPDAKKFEEQCEKALKYIFANDFSSWKTQNKTKDTLHIFDLIAKISSTNDFWKSLSRDFNSRFVVFEFKNYSEKIKQGQVYTTDKYLFKTALRTIAFIISREGADDNAITAMEGSLRENGKLIINLDLKEICKLLTMKDAGDDPNTYLSEKIDDILMTLSR